MDRERTTIFALSSASGRAAVAVIRASGPGAGEALTRLTGRAVPAPRVATLARLRNPANGETLDQALTLWFPGPGSETGEDMAEFQIHGGRSTVAAVLGALGDIPGLRPAGPGEFARRAFDNGKLDLTRAEALADLIDAETDAQRGQALRQLRGDLGRLYESWRGRLLKALAYREAAIDFPDETEGDPSLAGIVNDIYELSHEVQQHLDDGRRGERLRDGFYIAIVGPPNVGKSSLLNALSRRDVAIVSEFAGTTRDVIETRLDLDGYPVILADTAGLRETAEPVEREGVRRARARAAEADLTVAVIDAAAWPSIPQEVAELIGPDCILVLNKIDLCACGGPSVEDVQTVLPASALTGAGIPELLGAIGHRAAAALATNGAPVLTRLRHRQALEECLDRLSAAQRAVEPELIAEDLRLAVRAIGRVVGRVDVEELLDLVFRDFCIGK